ncbi:FAD-dependent oxidoreductase [Cellulomonas chengniuliangii]|uniref:FAD-dependent oxidoreductase n=1 Tax=Cellulomonas chengniuliangii TaxID=2968084 RepID=A0ABY5L3Q3_9CELL|nr:FAD-dependent oxidoreductase [Cellulomonas chengniuliangii]MCC2308294.1 FAD-dependent oxidoreductase [Cellulomonas chengniuliangii]UUI76678.1 FAD-dependent oxidoreductase [Cellulomonas chengniuliangii]
MFVSEPGRQAPVVGSYDVIVCGGGPAGLVAATAAARNGAKTLLIERYGFVGGMATSALVTPISEFRHYGKQHIGGIPFELMVTAAELGGAEVSRESGNYPVNDEILKLAAQRMLLDSGVTLLYHSWFSDCVTQDGRVTHVIVQNKAGRVAYEGKVFIDCTGDADLVRAAGYETIKGDVLQPASLWFQLGGVDTDALEYLFGDAVDAMLPVSAVIRDRLTELHGQGVIPIFGGPWINRFFHDGMVSINLLREATDASDPEWFTRTECSMRETLHLIIEVLRENFPEFKDCWLAKSGIQTGVRETYHIVGEYELCKDDIVTPKAFPDTIAKGAHVIDIHATDSTEQNDMVIPRQEYNVPLRCLVPRGSVNLVTAGRCLSADGPGFGSVRVMATCMAMGQGAGTAAALSVRHGYSMSAMDDDLLRATLVAQGAIVDFDNTVNPGEPVAVTVYPGVQN